MPRKPAPRKASSRTPRRPKPRFTPSQSRDELRILLRSGWQSIAAIKERLDVSHSTAKRRLRELDATDPLESQESDGAASLWRLPPSSREHALHITTSEMVSLRFVRNALGFLTGTGIKEDIDTLCDRFAHALKSSDYAHWKTLHRKLYDVNEGVYRYDGGDANDSSKLDVVNDVITGLLREERLSLTLADRRTIAVDPYTLVLYKKGLYVLGFSHAHGEVRSFGLDKIEDSDRPGEGFAYPPDFDAREHMSGPFGIIRGAVENVVLRFDASVARYVTRRTWHATQAFRAVDGGIEMTLEPAGTVEIVSWVLGFGGKAEVIGPASLRERVAREAREAAARYAGG